MIPVEVLGKRWDHPIACASGALAAHLPGMEDAVLRGAAAIFTKTITESPREGHPGPVFVDYPDEGYALNAMGLPNPGPDRMVVEIEEFRDEFDVPVYASVAADGPEGFRKLARAFSDVADGLELNVSCPHAGKGYGAELGSDPEAVAEITEAAVRAFDGPMSVKLTPNVDRETLLEVAAAAIDAGAEALTAVNTLGPGLRIDLRTASPVLGAGVGGLSGPALKPIALRVVADLALEFGEEVEIIGVGGIRSGEDVVEFLLAGAKAVQVATAAREKDFGDIAMETYRILKELGYEEPEEAIGAALPEYRKRLRRLGWCQ
ncbi:MULTISPECIES: dihydroorotate dehydrogenase [unclassified Methanopyrus]|uniref:dihydroorotate dehydrogenase n=1 Tax=Methanopyrus sp. SNP6 TaxID=1937005 RepID=UPI0011E58E17|nr:dihydroorotate dehydrogenase [Methanopyrus sp. SNP6]